MFARCRLRFSASGAPPRCVCCNRPGLNRRANGDTAPRPDSIPCPDCRRARLQQSDAVCPVLPAQIWRLSVGDAAGPAPHPRWLALRRLHTIRFGTASSSSRRRRLSVNPAKRQMRRPRESGGPGQATEIPGFPLSRERRAQGKRAGCTGLNYTLEGGGPVLPRHWPHFILGRRATRTRGPV